MLSNRHELMDADLNLSVWSGFVPEDVMLLYYGAFCAGLITGRQPESRFCCGIPAVALSGTGIAFYLSDT